MPGVDKSKLQELVQHRAELAKPAMPVPVQVQVQVRVTDSAEMALNDLWVWLSAERRNTAEELTHAMFPVFCASMGTARCLLFMQTRSGEYRVRHGYGKGIDELKTKFKIPAEFKPTTFHAVIKNNVDVSIADVARLKSSSLPEGYQDYLPSVSKFIILPIANVRVCGLLYCDWDSDRDITPAELVCVRKLRDLFLPFFPQS